MTKRHNDYSKPKTTNIPTGSLVKRRLLLLGCVTCGFFVMQMSLDFMKKCCVCGQIKSKTEFYEDKKQKDKLRCQCKECIGQYYQEHKERIRQRNFKNREHRREYDKQYKTKNKEHLDKGNKQWRLKNKEHLAKYMKKWQSKNKKHLKEYNHQWRIENKEYVTKKERLYSQTPKGKESQKRQNAKRYNLGFNPLNKFFKGSVGHHINSTDVVYIPKEIHIECYCGRSVEKHRRLVLEYYGSLENMINNIRKR